MSAAYNRKTHEVKRIGIEKNASVTRTERIYFIDNSTQDKFNLINMSFSNIHISAQYGITNFKYQFTKFKIRTRIYQRRKIEIGF